MQKVCGINTVLLDKTATITQGKLTVTEVIAFAVERNFALKLACGIEKNSNHPLAKCLVDYAKESFEVENFEYIVGKGATAEYENKKYYLGNEKLLENIKISQKAKSAAQALSQSGNTVVYLADESGVLAVIAFADTVKEGSKDAIALLKNRNLRVAMLTGDSQATAQAVADAVGIDEFVAEVLPEDKRFARTERIGRGNSNRQRHRRSHRLGWDGACKRRFAVFGHSLRFEPSNGQKHKTKPFLGFLLQRDYDSRCRRRVLRAKLPFQPYDCRGVHEFKLPVRGMQRVKIADI